MQWNCSYRFKGRKEKTLYLAVWMMLSWKESGGGGGCQGVAQARGLPTTPPRQALSCPPATTSCN